VGSNGVKRPIPHARSDLGSLKRKKEKKSARMERKKRGDRINLSHNKGGRRKDKTGGAAPREADRVAPGAKRTGPGMGKETIDRYGKSESQSLIHEEERKDRALE